MRAPTNPAKASHQIAEASLGTRTGTTGRTPYVRVRASPPRRAPSSQAKPCSAQGKGAQLAIEQLILFEQPTALSPSSGLSFLGHPGNAFPLGTRKHRDPAAKARISDRVRPSTGPPTGPTGATEGSAFAAYGALGARVVPPLSRSVRVETSMYSNAIATGILMKD